jgi:hypothetical protein
MVPIVQFVAAVSLKVMHEIVLLSCFILLASLKRNSKLTLH